MTELRKPTAGGSIRIQFDGNGGIASSRRVPLADPLEGANDGERAFYLANYQGVPLLELLQRLRRAEWDADQYKRQAEVWEAYHKGYPALHLIQAMNERHKRIRALLDNRRRRTFTRIELEDALDLRVDAPATVEGA